MTYEEAVRYLLTLGRELASPLRALGLFVIPSAARNLNVARFNLDESSHRVESGLRTA
jgi:hypothetical protein